MLTFEGYKAISLFRWAANGHGGNHCDNVSDDDARQRASDLIKMKAIDRGYASETYSHKDGLTTSVILAEHLILMCQYVCYASFWNGSWKSIYSIDEKGKWKIMYSFWLQNKVGEIQQKQLLNSLKLGSIDEGIIRNQFSSSSQLNCIFSALRQLW